MDASDEAQHSESARESAGVQPNASNQCGAVAAKHPTIIVARGGVSLGTALAVQLYFILVPWLNERTANPPKFRYEL